MTPLIDADVLRYEIGFSGQIKEEGRDTPVPLQFSRVADLLDEKINKICEAVGADSPPVLYLTASEKLCNKLGLEYVPNFREVIATTKPYKGTRKPKKPYHFDNLTHHILMEYNTQLAIGIEADDLMCVHQQLGLNGVGPETVICSRDKDLRMMEGWHYSWQCGKQMPIGPHYANKKGSLTDKGGKVLGYGELFFYYQLLVGDSVDNIPGVPSMGHVRAMKLLNNPGSRSEVYDIVKGEYERVYGEDWEANLLEQAKLLWMVRELDESSSPIMWSPPST